MGSKTYLAAAFFFFSPPNMEVIAYPSLSGDDVATPWKSVYQQTAAAQ